MAKLQTKWIADDAVNESKLKLSNDGYLRGRNVADSADVNIIKVNASDEIELASVPVVAGDNLATETYVDNSISGLGSVFTYEGTYNASTNSPALADGGGTAGETYRVSVAGTQDFGSGNITFEVDDKVVYNTAGVWEKWDVVDNEFATSDTDDLAEGATNLYYTQARFDSAFGAKSTTDLSEGTNLYYTQARFDSAFTAKDTDALSEGAANFYYTEARFDSSFGGKSTTDLSEGTNLYFTEARVEGTTLSTYVVGADAALANTDTVAGAFGKVQGQINALSSATQSFGKESFTLIAGDITNGYVDLAQTPLANSLRVFVVGSPEQEQGVDYTVSTNRVTFAGDLAAELVAGDKLIVNYAY